MSPDPRLIYVDDTSPLISYQGSWAEGDTYTSAHNYYGAPFNDTLHALSGSGSFTFDFKGPSVSVIGSFQNSTRPDWTCFIDGEPLTSIYISDLNNVEICSSKNVASKTTPNRLTVVATGTSKSPFLFDRIQYAPDTSVLLDNATVAVDAFDDQIDYSSGWVTYESGLGWETSKSASLTFDFVGIQLTWMTTISSSDGVPSSAQYSIDGGSLIDFQVATGTSISETAPHYNLISFQTPILSPGSHHLFVQYAANPDSTAPLRLDKFVIQNLTFPSSSKLVTPFSVTPFSVTASSVTSSSVTTSSVTPSPTTPRSTTISTPSPTITPVSRKLSAGALSGVVIGSLVGGTLIIFGLIWVTRFFKRKLATMNSLIIREQAVPYIKTVYHDDHDGQLQGNWSDRQSEGNWRDRQSEGNSNYSRTLIA